MVTLAELKKDEEVLCYIEMANYHLGAMGFTDHSFRHVEIVSARTAKILEQFNYPPRIVDLGGMAGYLHDIGNVVSRHDHSQSGALLAHSILKRMGMKYQEIAMIMGAIGNHDEAVGQIVNVLAAALVLADKTDVHRTRVRNKDFAKFDIHDRVNYAVEQSDLHLDPINRLITLQLTIDTKIVPVIEYFEIFLVRMMMCRRAASFLDCQFSIIINEATML